MKRAIIAIGALALSLACNYATADEPGSGHNVDVIPGEWGEDDPTLNFNFQDMPTASFSGLRLHLNCGLEGAQILYTTDPAATPQDESAWTVYTEPLYLEEDCTIRFFARCEGYMDSEIQTYEHVYADWQTATPEITANTENNTVAISCATEGAEICYTTDGSEPTKESELYTGPVNAENGMKFRARAFAEGLYDSEISEMTVSDLNAVEAITLEGIRIAKEGGVAVVYSDKALRLAIYTPDGRLVRTVEVTEGRNAIEGLGNGLFIIGNVRIKL